MRNFLIAVLCLFGWTAFGAPADDGQSAGARTWTLNQARSAAAVTTSDSTDLTVKPTRALYNGNATACAIAVRMADDGSTAQTFNNVQPGAILPIQVNRVMATNTTCSTILALY